MRPIGSDDEVTVSYAYTAGMPTDQRRRRRAVRLVLLGLVLAALLVGGWALLHTRGGTTQPQASGTTCPDPPAGVTIDVLNATSRAGLASLTADTLRAQRFAVGQAVNAPAGTKITTPAEVRYGKAGITGAKVLAHRIRGALLVEIPRAGTRIDLVIGNDFDAITTPTTAPSC